MRLLPELFRNNEEWARARRAEDPEFFVRLMEGQSPDYLWIGCADSRVPATSVVGLGPGDLFVHRNVANLVDVDDLNCHSVIQYAVGTLRVAHVIVCGHYGCGGVQAALGAPTEPPLEEWLRPVRRVAERHRDELAELPDEDQRWRRLCELNVAAQVEAACRIPTIAEAWAAGGGPAVHGWIFDPATGGLRDLDLTRNSHGS